jgi:hypothetical protein
LSTVFDGCIHVLFYRSNRLPFRCPHSNSPYRDKAGIFPIALHGQSLSFRLSAPRAQRLFSIPLSLAGAALVGSQHCSY